MNSTEWKKTASPQALAQFNLPDAGFKRLIKCCENCPYWQRDPMLHSDYGVNHCRLRGKSTHWRHWCRDYAGTKAINNLLDYAEVTK